MMSVETIRALEEEAGRRAARAKRVPYVPYTAATVEHDIRGIPNLGSYRPKGWRLERSLFVDMRCFPVSSLPQDPAGRMQTIVEFVQAGWLTPRQGRRLMDKSGMGSESEPAMTFPTFCAYVRGHMADEYGYAMVGEGQFQVYIGVFKRVESKRRSRKVKVQ